MILAIEHLRISITTGAIKINLINMAETEVNKCREVSVFASSQKWHPKNKTKSMGSDKAS